MLTPPKKAVATQPAAAGRKKAASKRTPAPAAEVLPGPLALSQAVKDSAQQIWQAGLGAFNQAQTEGSKAFEALVREGIEFQQKTQAVAEEKISEASQKMTELASDITSKASAPWGRLEGIFEDRVAQVLARLEVPSAQDLRALNQRLDALSASVDQWIAQQQAARPVPKTAQAAAKKPARSQANPD